MASSAIPKRIPDGAATTSLLARKLHLFNTHARKELFKEIRENAMGDKKGEFGKDRLFQRVGQIHNIENPQWAWRNGFLDYGGAATSVHTQGTFSRYSGIIFNFDKKRRTKRLKK